MANLDDNPFADPFSDPSVQRAAQSGANEPNFGQPAPPPSTHKPAGQDDLLKRQEELERKAAELKRREEDLERRAAQGGGQPAHNWPPLPSFIPWQPCFYHDINVEIPPEFQSIVTFAYRLWMVYAATIVANIVGCMIYWWTGGNIGTFLLSILQCAIFVPCSMLFWYRPLYKAFRNDSSFQFMVFFFVMVFQIIFAIVLALGLSSWGCGWWTTIDHFAVSTFGALVMCIPALGYTACAVGFVLLIVKVHSLYRATGASMAKAQQEFQSGVMSNPNVRNAAGSAATSAARNAFNGGRY